jgi:hypothetical protein
MPSTFTPKACADAVVAILNGIAGISSGAGQVHARRRIVRSEGDIRAVMAGNGGKVNCWMVSPAAADATVTERHSGFNAIGQAGGGRVLVTYQLQVEAYFYIDDGAGTEETFRDLVDTVAMTLNGYGVLNIPGAIFQLPCNVEQFGFIMLAGLGLYHYARLGIGFRGQRQP